MTHDAVAVALQGTRPPLAADLAAARQWLSDVKAVIRALRSRDPQFDPERFLTLTGFTGEYQRRLDAL